MSSTRRWLVGGTLAFATTTLGLAPEANATGFADYGKDLESPEEIVDLSGAFRARGNLFYNLDLDRGPTPSGEPLYPTPVSDPSGQTLTRADMRLRTDAALYAPDGGAAVKVRADFLDNVALGSAPEGVPAAATSQSSELALVRIKRVYGEVLTPVGLIAVGRMGSQWGLGMLANGGDCEDCDSGDAVDRIAFITPLVGHIWALSYDFSATGPFVDNNAGTNVIDIEPSANVHTLTFAMMRYTAPRSLERRARAGRATFNYGAYFSHRFQENDIPVTYVPTAQPVPIDNSQIMMRGYTASAVDLWLRLTGPGYRVEAEAAYLHANVEQASLIPGVLFREEVTSDQFGVALESEFGNREWDYAVGLNAGFASGDSAPGFGAFPEAGSDYPAFGDLDGPQALPPFDTDVNNFRMHPDYHVDRILFREIIGTVTDALYLKPHASFKLWQTPRGALSASFFAVASFAASANSTPGGERPLAIELDPSIRYDTPFGFAAAIEQATLLPLDGLDNPALGLDARPAQLWRLRLHFGF